MDDNKQDLLRQEYLDLRKKYMDLHKERQDINNEWAKELEKCCDAYDFKKLESLRNQATTKLEEIMSVCKKIDNCVREMHIVRNEE